MTAAVLALTPRERLEKKRAETAAALDDIRSGRTPDRTGFQRRTFMLEGLLQRLNKALTEDVEEQEFYAILGEQDEGDVEHN